MCRCSKRATAVSEKQPRKGNPLSSISGTAQAIKPPAIAQEGSNISSEERANIMITNYLSVGKARTENIIKVSDTKIKKHLVAVVATLADKHS